MVCICYPICLNIDTLYPQNPQRKETTSVTISMKSFLGPPYEPKEFAVVIETSISVTVRWKAGFAAGFEPQTFGLEYEEISKSGK